MDDEMAPLPDRPAILVALTPADQEPVVMELLDAGFVVLDARTPEDLAAATMSTEDLPDINAIPAAARPMLTLANVVKPDGKPIAAPILYREVKTKDGRKVRVALIGLVGKSPFERPLTAGTTATPGTAVAAPGNANLPTGGGDGSAEPKPYEVKDPAETLRAVLPEARKKADIVVVLFSAMRDQARRLVTDVPGVDLMIAGLEGAVDMKPEMVGTTALVQNGDRGRYASAIGITLDKDKHPVAYDMRSTPLDSTIPDDPNAAKLVQQFREKQAIPIAAVVKPTTGPTTPGTTGTTSPTTTQARSVFAGSYSCSGCHAKEFNQWKSTKHAAAMRVLEAKDNGLPARRPDCVKCHVVGFDKPGGYDITQPRWDLRDVGCEACHGAAAGHVAARQQGLKENFGLVRSPSKDTCVSCHNADNDPNFDYAKYLPHVMHNFSGPLPKLPEGGSPNAMAPAHS
jgi:hypothetical protein